MKFTLKLQREIEQRGQKTKTLIFVNDRFSFTIFHYSCCPIKLSEAGECFKALCEEFLYLHPREGQPNYSEPSMNGVKEYTGYFDWLSDFGYLDSVKKQLEWRNLVLKCRLN
jgi:hypothetical protein